MGVWCLCRASGRTGLPAEEVGAEAWRHIALRETWQDADRADVRDRRIWRCRTSPSNASKPRCAWVCERGMRAGHLAGTGPRSRCDMAGEGDAHVLHPRTRICWLELQEGLHQRLPQGLRQRQFCAKPFLMIHCGSLVVDQHPCGNRRLDHLYRSRGSRAKQKDEGRRAQEHSPEPCPRDGRSKLWLLTGAGAGHAPAHLR